MTFCPVSAHTFSVAIAPAVGYLRLDCAVARRDAEFNWGRHALSSSNKVLTWISGVLSFLALAACAGLLISDARLFILSKHASAAISAAPLLLVGVAFLFAQLVNRPRFADLVKNLLLAGTFLLWGVVQLMPHNELARRLGNLVIVLYVLDLTWIILAPANSRQAD